MRQKGKVKSWNDDKGCGFIQPMLDGKDIFFHITAFSSNKRRPDLGQLVTYRVGKDSTGRIRAESISFSADQISSIAANKGSGSHFSVVIALLFLVFVALSAFFTPLPLMIAFVYMVLSLLTFVFYWIDKQQAQRGGQRTPENTLHVLSVLGGWPGAVFAQQIFRHKTKKQSFRQVFWVTCAVNCVVLGWLMTEQGSQWLIELIELGVRIIRGQSNNYFN